MKRRSFLSVLASLPLAASITADTREAPAAKSQRIAIDEKTTKTADGGHEVNMRWRRLGSLQHGSTVVDALSLLKEFHRGDPDQYIVRVDKEIWHEILGHEQSYGPVYFSRLDKNREGVFTVVVENIPGVIWIAG